MVTLKPCPDPGLTGHDFCTQVQQSLLYSTPLGAGVGLWGRAITEAAGSPAHFPPAPGVGVTGFQAMEDGWGAEA